jgi:hypothetical protein
VTTNPSRRQLTVLLEEGRLQNLEIHPDIPRRAPLEKGIETLLVCG